MNQSDTKSRFEAELLRPANLDVETSWAFVVLPKDVSMKLPRRGRTTVLGTINGHDFQATLEPDGQLSHWLRISQALLKTTETRFGDIVALEIMSVGEEPDPEMPPDLQEALARSTDARVAWEDITTVARLDWIHWITSAKQSKTRAKRIRDAYDMLATGKRRVCCFDSSGYYSKAFSAPNAAS